MALNIKDPETERLASDVAALAGETKTRAVRTALEERRARLGAEIARKDREARLRRFLEDEAWPVTAPDGPRSPMTMPEREAVLGYGPDGG